MTRLAAHRRSPAALALFVLLGLVVTGMLYAALKPGDVTATTATNPGVDIEAGEELFIANCASCHGVNGQGNGTAGPPLAGVGALAVDFQVGTGRMPMTQPNVQADAMKVVFTDEQIAQMAAYVATLGPGPGLPDEEFLDPALGDAASGGAIFRVNCAMCHNASGSGGALTQGKDAPSLMQVDPKYIYAAMETGPQSMPVFNDETVTPEEKRDVIAFLKDIEEGNTSFGGQPLGSLGPGGDALFVWTFGIGLLIVCAIWLTRKAR